MFPDTKTVVRRKNNDGIINLATAFKYIKDTSYLKIHFAHHAIIISPFSKYLSRNARSGKQLFIAFIKVTVVKWVLCNKILGHRNLSTSVFMSVVRQHIARIMRRSKCNIHQKRSVVRRLSFKKSDSSIGI